MKAVIPAAGFGTRFLPATKVQPKEMLPVLNKPVIQYVVEEAVAAGVTDIVIITNSQKQSIESHFNHSEHLENFLNKKGKAELTVARAANVDAASPWSAWSTSVVSSTFRSSSDGGFPLNMYR